MLAGIPDEFWSGVNALLNGGALLLLRMAVHEIRELVRTLRAFREESNNHAE